MKPRRQDGPVSVDNSEKVSSVVDLGLVDYRTVYALQLDLVDKRRSGELSRDIFLIVEHPSTFTLGRRGGRQHLMVSEEFLEAQKIPLVHIERGGDITFHGEGQLVIYPIVSLRDSRLSVADYVAKLEEIMLQLATCVGIEAGRSEKNHGIWVGNKKLGSVGIAIRHGVSFHGLALNVNVSLEPFSWVNPCGLTGVSMTSLRSELDRNITLGDMKKDLIPTISKVFQTECLMVDKSEILKETSDA